MLIINPKYNGSFKNQAKKEIELGNKIGICWINEESDHWECHRCNVNNDIPILDLITKDAWTNCYNCNSQFIVVYI